MKGCFVPCCIFELAILSLFSVTSCNGEDRKSIQSSLSHLNISNAPISSFLHFNNFNKHDNSNSINHSNHTYQKLDKVFGVDSSIFDDYLKNVDLTIIPGLTQDSDFEFWDPPHEVHRDLPLYMSGFDFYDRPIWVIEFGKWRLLKYATTDQKKVALFEKYMRNFAYTILKSQALRSTKEQRVTQYMLIIDYEGLMSEYLINRRVLRFLMKMFSNYRRFAEKYAAKSIAINVNPISEILLNLMRPLYNRFLEKIEVYGTNKYIWAPQLLKSFPKDQIPEWYGGSKGHVPFHTYKSTH